MFFVGGIMRELLQPDHTEYFFRGYGDAAIDPDALSYYRNAWAVQDVAANGEQVFLQPELGEESKRVRSAGSCSSLSRDISSRSPSGTDLAA